VRAVVIGVVISPLPHSTLSSIHAALRAAMRSMVPGAGIELARLAAGDFESVIYSVSTGKWGEF